LIRIKAPKQMGKTSLMVRILAQARTAAFHTVTLNFHLAEIKAFTDLRQFLHWFCTAVGQGLNLPNRLVDYWDDIFGANYNSTDYFENYLLPAIEAPLVLALDEIDVIFNHPEIATDFFGLLRVWYEKSKYGDGNSHTWQKLRLVMVHSTEVYIPININQSPFNVGLSVNLPEFTPEQVKELAQRHGLNWSEPHQGTHITQLMHLVGGNPYLIRMALYHLSHGQIDIEHFLQTATQENSVYSEHLWRQLKTLQEHPELLTSYQKVVLSSASLEAIGLVQAMKLQSMGLIKVQLDRIVSSCDLYHQYFSLCLASL
ncbi:MAG: family 3 adenylate cyclase, partial [Cyanothece sp. SIO1E1]|nr:family 3 adenylate cyclase [Cyanothece sp. SIO1E1]